MISRSAVLRDSQSYCSTVQHHLHKLPGHTVVTWNFDSVSQRPTFVLPGGMSALLGLKVSGQSWRHWKNHGRPWPCEWSWVPWRKSSGLSCTSRRALARREGPAAQRWEGFSFSGASMTVWVCLNPLSGGTSVLSGPDFENLKVFLYEGFLVCEPSLQDLGILCYDGCHFDGICLV